MLYQTRDHSPSAINRVEHDLPTLNGLKYMPRLTSRSSCNAITETGILLAAWRGPSIL